MTRHDLRIVLLYVACGLLVVVGVASILIFGFGEPTVYVSHPAVLITDPLACPAPAEQARLVRDTEISRKLKEEIMENFGREIAMRFKINIVISSPDSAGLITISAQVRKYRSVYFSGIPYQTTGVVTGESNITPNEVVSWVMGQISAMEKTMALTAQVKKRT